MKKLTDKQFRVLAAYHDLRESTGQNPNVFDVMATARVHAAIFYHVIGSLEQIGAIERVKLNDKKGKGSKSLIRITDAGRVLLRIGGREDIYPAPQSVGIPLEGFVRVSR